MPQIEWRVVFLEQLQKTQQEFLKTQTLKESNDYLIFEDTLDENQNFYCASNEWQYANDAPFFLELPVMVPGTGNILNGIANAGNANYDGPGLITPVITGAAFTKIDGSNAKDIDAVRAIQQQVRETPLSWTVTTDPSTHQQTLLVNAGISGTTDPTEGITWSMASKSNWPLGELQKKINECDTKIEAIRNGQDSPIALFYQRANTLYNLLKTAVSLPANAGQKAELQDAMEEWRSDYEDWMNDERIAYLEPLAKEDKEGNWVLIRPLPKQELITALEDCVANAKGTKLANTTEYKNYILSLTNLQADQRTYLINRLQYGADWEAAKESYQSAYDFYKDGRIYGFVVKVRTQSINTSMTTYRNSAQVDLEKKKWKAEDSTSIRFTSGIIGNYALGDFVLQKADAYYDTGATDVKEIQTVEKANAGLAGAKFQVYCGVGENADGTMLNEDYLAYFLDKDASENGDTYRFNRTGNSGLDRGELSTLEVNANGKLILSNIVAHPHFLVETEAPDGYYLSTEPIRVDNKTGEVNYKLVPNVSRSVLLYKKDSYSNNPVEGAEFALYRKDGETETPITGFAAKNVNGHQTYWKTEGGTEKLLTNEDGALCIHGLDAGEYVLREVNPAAGYLTPAELPAYSFRLGENLPAADNADYDAEGHLLLNTADRPLTNDPNVASLTMKKTNLSKIALSGAGFALFRFTGTEKQWREDSNNGNLWQAVSLDDAKYFQTDNTIRKTSLAGDGQMENDNVDAILTDDKGEFTLTEIPFGHYCVSEVIAPSAKYQRDYRSFYFNVNGDTVGTSVQLYTDSQEKEELKDNTLTNYHRRAFLALVKYDAAKGAPQINGDKIGDGWQYTDTILNAGEKGLQGAVYKLFMYQGDSTTALNPDPAQLASETITPYNKAYDTCVAVGTTDENGILQVTEMTGLNGKKIADGLSPAEYYMIEVKAPAGYLLDQTPIRFPLDETVFPQDETALAGLIMTAENYKIDYGIHLKKVDAEDTAVGLKNAEFSVKKGNTTLSFIKKEDGTYQQTAADTENAVTTVATDADGALTLIGLEKETTYTLTETKAPQGYAKLTQPISVTTVSDAADARIENHVLFPKTDIQVADTRLKGRVTLHKRAAETEISLEDAEFALYQIVETVIPPDDTDYDPEHPDAVRTEDKLIGTKTTDADGNLAFEDLPWGEYYLQETRAPQGYLRNETKWTFSIGASSFDAEGNAIPVVFPAITNSKEILGEAILTKVDARNSNTKLQGAQFYLEKELQVENEPVWVGYGQGMYQTDENGEIRFLLPPGKYRVTEIKAPEGYRLEDTAEPVVFQIAEDGAFIGDLQIANTRIKHGGGGGGSERAETSVTVQKVWKNSDTHPKSVYAQLYCNGSAYGRAVKLCAENKWSYTWSGLNDADKWIVDEVTVPQGFEKQVSHKGNDWTITNVAQKEVPADPTQPTNPTDSIDPNQPTNPTDPTNPNQPAEPTNPTDPNQPTNPSNPEQPTESNSSAQTPVNSAVPTEKDEEKTSSDAVPQTGDAFPLPFWQGLLCLSLLGMGLLKRFFSGSQRKHK